MMNDTYVEVMVKCKPDMGKRILQIVSVVLAVASFLLFMGLLGMLLAVVFAAAAYFLGLYVNTEYEYLYVDRELSVDRILSQSKRKKAGKFDLNKMEILAPFRSWHLEDYKNRKFSKTQDFSSHDEGQQPDRRYVLVYEGDKKLILEPNAAMVKAIQQIAPRKVFTD